MITDEGAEPGVGVTGDADTDVGVTGGDAETGVGVTGDVDRRRRDRRRRYRRRRDRRRGINCLSS